MIRCTSNSQRRHIILSGDTSHIGPEAFFQIRTDDIFSTFGTEYAVDMVANV